MRTHQTPSQLGCCRFLSLFHAALVNLVSIRHSLLYHIFGMPYYNAKQFNFFILLKLDDQNIPQSNRNLKMFFLENIFHAILIDKLTNRTDWIPADLIIIDGIFVKIA